MLTFSGLQVAVKPGAYVVPDGWRGFGGRIWEAGDDFSTYRIWTNSGGPIESLAVEIEIAGRTIQQFQGNDCVRVRVVFKGDYEPDQTTGGWMKIE